MKRYNVILEKEYDRWDDYTWHSLEVKEDKKGEWVKACEAIKLEKKIERMQRRIDKLEGRE